MRTVRSAVMILALALVGGCAAAPGPSTYGVPDPADREALLALVQRTFDTLMEPDDGFFDESLVEQGTFTSVATVDGERRVGVRTFAEDREAAAGREPGRFLERSWDPIVLVDGDVATVFCRYDFHLDGVLSHCGTDVITCVRAADGWRITHLAWSVETDCEASPLGPPSTTQAEPGSAAP